MLRNFYSIKKLLNYLCAHAQEDGYSIDIQQLFSLFCLLWLWNLFILGERIELKSSNF